MAKNQEQRDRERNKRLQKNYRWTLEQRTRLSEKQGHKCGICGRPESDAMPLNIDHYHFRITFVRCTPKEPKKGLPENGLCSLEYNHGWIAVASLPHHMLNWRWAKTRDAVKKLAYDDALPYSVRGLLCPGRYAGCNRLLGHVDDTIWLEKALAYLKNPPARGIL